MQQTHRFRSLFYSRLRHHTPSPSLTPSISKRWNHTVNTKSLSPCNLVEAKKKIASSFGLSNLENIILYCRDKPPLRNYYDTIESYSIKSDKQLQAQKDAVLYGVVSVRVMVKKNLLYFDEPMTIYLHYLLEKNDFEFALKSRNRSYHFEEIVSVYPFNTGPNESGIQKGNPFLGLKKQVIISMIDNNEVFAVLVKRNWIGRMRSMSRLLFAVAMVNAIYLFVL